MNTLYTLGRDTAVQFAGRELARYLKAITGQTYSMRTSQRPPLTPDHICLGICDQFNENGWPDLVSSYWDDAFSIRQNGHQLTISGSNGRSVLFGVYAYLEHLGVRWVRPGRRGELLPRIEHLPEDHFEQREKASYRHRGTCIEGSPSLTHVIGMVDWMAKRRMNSFFLQFQNSGTFWKRWYERSYNPYYGRPQQLGEADCAALDSRVIAEIKKRGMLLHRVGHGWTAACVDLPCNSWATTDLQVPARKKRWLARVNGKRVVFTGIPVNTELCYSHGPAFRALLNTIARYARSHPEVDVLHVWLSDSMNNKCECAECAVLTPPDWYARLVNALAERLFETNPQQRFVFLSYFESWWAPTKLQVESPHGNAILMFAPISRCYRHSLTDLQCNESFPPERPKLNHASMPHTNQPFMKFLDGWWTRYNGDSFLFDYYLWSGLHEQALDVTLARLIHQDMQDLRQVGLNGHISCQVMRCFWPTGLSMVAMAETTWNHKRRWHDIERTHFQSSYGPDADWARAYIAHLEKLILEKPQHHGMERMEAKSLRQLRIIEAYLKEYSDELLARANRADKPVYRESLELLAHHNRFLLMRCQAVQGTLDPEVLKVWLLKSERQIHPFLDIPALMSRQLRPRQPIL